MPETARELALTSPQEILAMDMGGTQLRAARIRHGHLESHSHLKVHAQGSMQEVLDQVLQLCQQEISPNTAAICIGVPSVVDVDTGIVYDVQNIPSWVEVPLKRVLEDRFQIPTLVNNDANCFALGEAYYGKGRDAQSLIGLSIGTGLGAGILIHGKLYAGARCGAGEFGMMDYLDHCYEYYASGQFFQNVHQVDGTAVFQQALAGDPKALKLYEELGTHLGRAIRAILYSYDPELILLGGSVSASYPYFQQAMWQEIKKLAYSKTVSRLRLEISELKDVALLGTAALYFDSLHP